MYWLRGWDLNEALETLTGKRRCSPRIESIRAATADLLTGTGPLPTTIAVRRRGTAETIQVMVGGGEGLTPFSVVSS
jgi:hypothetical protein